jgi:hypothetical protein
MKEGLKQAEIGNGCRSARRTNRRANALFLRIAGKRLRAYSILKHIGRNTGREYVTPLSAYPLDDGFVLAVLYGESVSIDWCRNIMAAGECVLVTGGKEYKLESPEILPASKALAAFPLFLRITYELRGIHEFVWLHCRS